MINPVSGESVTFNGTDNWVNTPDILLEHGDGL